MYKCFTCGNLLPLTEFYVEKSKRGHTRNCRNCIVKRNKNWRQNNPDKFIQQKKQYRRKATENARKHRELHRQEYRAESRQQYWKNRQERIQKARDYRKKNQFREYAHGIIKNHLKSKKINKPDNCEICRRKKFLIAHHDDYSKPLDVIWICYSCHGYLHRGIA